MIGFLANIETRMIEHFVQSAHQGEILYPLAVGLMVATCFGLPLPEEFIIIAMGLAAHIGGHPELYPVPEGTLLPVTLLGSCIFLWSSVLIGDGIIYSLGRYVGKHPGRRRWVEKILKPEKFEKISLWMKKYGFWTVAVFRVTPGLRLPGQFSCGLFGVPPLKFFAVDGLMASLMIPTQLTLLYFYGDKVLDLVHRLKGGFLLLIIIGVLAVALIFLFKKYGLYFGPWKRTPKSQ